MASPQHSPRSRLRVQSRVNDNQCVKFVMCQKDSVCVTGQTGLNPPVLAGDKKVTLNLNFVLQMLILSPGCHKGKA